MLIRKKWRTEGPAHIVRNCSTDRCSKSIHGHTYEWEVIFSGSHLDNGGMLIDFGLLKQEVGTFLDMFDHAHMMWSKEPKLDIFYDFSDRFVIVPFTPSAENLALFVFATVQEILNRTDFANGETDARLHSVIVHETQTGYAQAFYSDLLLVDYMLDEIEFKHDTGFWADLTTTVKRFQKQKPVHQIGGSNESS